MHLRPYRETDADAIESLLVESWPDDPILRQLHALHGPAVEDPLRRTLIAEVNGKPVAAGTVRLSRRHPARYWLGLNVAPEWRGQGIGSQLLAALKGEIRHDARPFRVQARPSDGHTTRFLQRHGFHPLVHTWEGTIDPSDPAVRERLAPLRRNATRFRLERSGQQVTDTQLNELARFNAARYAASHRWDPPADWTLAEAREHFCGPGLVWQSTVRAFDADMLAGAGSLIAPPFDPESDELYLSDIGVVGLPRSEANALTAALVDEVLAYAAAVGRIVRFEVDDSHPDLWTAIEALPILSSERDFAVFTDDVDRDR